MPNTPPPRDPNRPKPRARQGARAEPEAAPQERAQSNDDARRDDALARQDEASGGLGVRTGGGYADQMPKTPPKRR